MESKIRETFNSYWSNLIISRVLRDSTPRFVGPSIGPSVGPLVSRSIGLSVTL